MRHPSISICIPAFKAERYLGETLDSVRAQEFADWELLLVEDGSRDRTQEIFEAFAAQVSQPVRFLRHEVNRGLTSTRNTAMAAANAPWIAILDSDDLWTPDHLATLWARARTGDADLVHGGSVLFDSETGRDLEIRAPDAEVIAAFPISLWESRYIIQPSSVLLAKSLWERVGGFHPDYSHLEDREMWMRCARAGARIAYTGRETCRYRKHGTAMSAQSAAMAEAAARVLDQHLDWEIVPETRRRQVTAEAWSAAARLCWRGAPALARRHFARACALEWRACWWLHGCLCALLPDRCTPASDGK
jgi:GT2 family glycosyltransferase